MSRISLVVAAALVICIPDSTPRARISCLPLSKTQANGGIQPILVVDGSPVHRVGNLYVHASNWGAIGSMPGSGMPFQDAPSAEWPAGSGVNYLFVAGLWVGALVHGAPAVSTSAYELEFRPSSDTRDIVYQTWYGADHGARIPANPDDDRDGVADEDPLDGYDNDHDGTVDEDFAGVSDQMMTRYFRDDQPGVTDLYPQHVPMHLGVREDSYAFAEPAYDDFVGFTFTITNTGADTLQNVYIGMMADGDVGLASRPNYWLDDAAAVASIPVDLGAHGVATYSFPYWRDADGDGGTAAGRCGFVLLDHTVDPSGIDAPGEVSLHSWTHFRGGASFEDGGDPTNDFERYEAMSSGVLAAPLGLGDVRTLMSVGPFPTMLPGKSLTFALALVVTPDDSSNVARAVEAYQGQWFDLDHNPATGVGGMEHQEHWYLPTDKPSPVWFAGFAAGPDGGAVKLQWLVVTDQSLDRIDVLRAPAAGGTPVTVATLPGNRREFVDTSLPSGGRYLYSVVASGRNGAQASSPWLEVSVQDLPTTFWLSSPNPFRESTTISAHFAESANVDLSVFDVAGRRVTTLASGPRNPGEGIFVWNGTDDGGRRVAAGVYFCRLEVGDKIFHEKLVVLR
jgi:hypothetical protein